MWHKKNTSLLSKLPAYKHDTNQSIVNVDWLHMWHKKKQVYCQSCLHTNMTLTSLLSMSTGYICDTKPVFYQINVNEYHNLFGGYLIFKQEHTCYSSCLTKSLNIVTHFMKHFELLLMFVVVVFDDVIRINVNTGHTWISLSNHHRYQSTSMLTDAL